MSFRGLTAPLAFGAKGLTGNKNPAFGSIENLLIAENLTFENGTIQKEGGAAKYNSTAITGGPKVLGLHDWLHNGTTQRLIAVLDDGTIKKDTGAGDFTVTLKSGLTIDEDDIPQFVEAGKEVAANNAKLFILTGVAQVQVLSADGATTSDLATPGADWGSIYPTTGVIHEGRFWGAGNSNDPHRVYYSMTTDHEDMTGSGAGSISVYPGDGTRGIKRIMSFKGFLLVFKAPRGVFIVDTTDPTIANWKTKLISSAVGIGGTGCVAQVEDDVIYIDSTANVRLLSTTTEFGDIGTRSVGDLNDINVYIKNNFNTQQIRRWKMLYYAYKRELHVAATGVGATSNSIRFVADFNGQAPRFRSSSRDTPLSLALQEQNNLPRLISGDDAGFVWKLDQDDRSVDSAAYQANAQSAYTDLSEIDPQLATRRKLGRFLELVAEPKGDWTINVDVFWDDILTQTVTFNMGSGSATLGSFILGTDVLSGTSVISRRRRITGGGRRLSLGVRNNGLSQDFSVGRFFLQFDVSDERI